MNTNTQPSTDTVTDNVTQTAANTAYESVKTCQRGHHCHGRGRRCWLMPLMLIGALLVGGLIGRACTHERMRDDARGRMGMQHSYEMQGDFSGPPMGGMRGGGFSPKMVERIADKVNATDEQKKKLNEIASKLNQDQTTRRTAMQSMRQKTIELLSANPIDTAAVEQVRASQIQFMDEQSKQMSQAMIEVAQVLTPEQRTQLANMRTMRPW